MDPNRNNYSSRVNSPARERRRAKLQTKKSVISHLDPQKDSVMRLKERAASKTSKDSKKSDSSKRKLSTKSTEKHLGNRRGSKIMLHQVSNLSITSTYASIPSLSDISARSSESSIHSNAEESHVVSTLKLIPPTTTRSGVKKRNQKQKVLATLIPDEILLDPVNEKSRSYHTALMFPDVSGFTQLCQKYDKTGKGGPSRLTEVLNGYIGSMIEIVLSRNGDVCKFGGDAFLCVWKVSEVCDIMEVVHLAIESAVNIQKNCGEHKTDVGVKLGVKIAVAAGKALFSIIGSETRKYYLIFGPPVLDVRDAEQLGKPGDVIVTPSAWKYVNNYMLYSYTYHADNKHIRVHDFGPLWKSAKVSFERTDESRSASYRPALRNTRNLNVEEIRPFILPPVMKSIDLNLSLDYLTEMRQVAIVFFNVQLDMVKLDMAEVVDISNKAFQIISGIVDKSEGATNKLTLFDKDMTILTVFGLKGYKHELASQEALKCAYACLEKLKKLEVLSVSAGVTTGMAYCGVIGHPLRKEYTVMGHPVNMAARLMCAYLNIVSLDRETFLYSKLESGHFELLENKNLKGIQNAGPFYKFNLRPKRLKIKLDIEAFTLLGRGKELKEFENFLIDSITNNSPTNFLVVYGNARVGKSRLVARFVNMAEKINTESAELNLRSLRRRKKTEFRENVNPAFDICIIPLTEDDSKVSYSTCRLIFQQLLELNDSISVEETEDKILLKFNEDQDIHLLAALNPIFKINFDLTQQYLALSSSEQLKIQQNLMKKLYSKCFPKGERWLIVIDDAEVMDDETWNVIKWCAKESRNFLYLITIGQRKALSTAASECLETVNSFKIQLTDLEKWYFAGLACQILGVKAIPVELLNMIQGYKSSGNPGWLESFLLSLIQSGGIYIERASAETVKANGLVTIPEMMLSKHPILEYEKRDHSFWMNSLDSSEQMADSSQLNLPACFLGPHFYTGKDIEMELTMDVMFIKIVDALKPLEQLVLKIGAVLSNNFKRAALKYIINKDMPLEEKQLAKAIKHLFEIKILTCAKGDFTKMSLLVPRKMMLPATIGKEVKCECVGLIIPEGCENLPKYANCGLMQFRSITFRDTVYNLLLDDQKKKFHYSKIEFLLRFTYKCKSCGGERFNNLIGYDEETGAISCLSTPMHGIRSTKLELKSNFPVQSDQETSAHRFSRGLKKARSSTAQSELDMHLLLTVDLSECQCSKILSAVYSVLLEHAAGCGKKNLILEIQFEYASLSLTTYNIPLTIQILEEALALVNQMKEEGEHPELCVPYIYAKIYVLMGATKLCMGRMDESLEFLLTSLKYFKKSFPHSNAAAKLLIRSHIFKKRLRAGLSNNSAGKISDAKAASKDLLAECLGLIGNAHMYKQNWLLAKYASLWGLNEALKSNRNLFGLCTAYTNLLEIAHYDNDLETSATLENCAIEVCKRCRKSIEVYEMEAICRLFKVIFQTKLIRAEIEKAVTIGFRSIKIASLIRSTTLRLEIMPDLIFALIHLNRLSEAVALLQELEFVSLLDSDKSGRIWYYAICLDFQLDTGFTVLPYSACEEFAKEEENFTMARDIQAKHRLFTSLWLWSIRNGDWELTKTHSKTLKLFNLFEGRETPTTVCTLLKRLEGFLIILVHRMDTRNIYQINLMFSEIHTIMNKLDKDIKTVKLLKAKYQVLKAYYNQIRYRDESYSRVCNQALAYAEKINDKNTTQWIVHLKQVWSNTISPIQRDYWVEHCRFNLIDWHESEKHNKKLAVMYSLPLPKF